MAYRINSGAARVPGNAWVIGPAIADNDYATNGHTSDVWHLRAARACWPPGLGSGAGLSPAACGAIGMPLAKNDCRRSICCPHFRGLSPVPGLVPAHERARAGQRSH
jgi:hypothetical protein